MPPNKIGNPFVIKFENYELQRVLIVIPAIYPSLVVNCDFS